MIPITMTRKIKGKEKIQELEKTYGTLTNLKKLFKNDDENMLLYSDLEDWEYFLDHPEEESEEGKTIFIENINLGQIELELIKSIKKEQPNSISELAKIMNKDISNIQRKINTLEQEGLVSFKNGTKNRKIPIINYDKIEIPL
jgi:predicted Rossmann fold nucleotide-binding protein DprA/Smf involved in DNA uptake